jgi:hypothetical protein
MSTWGWIIVAVGVAVFVLISLRLAVKHRRTRQLRDRFGPEYDRTVESAASKREAEADLAEREQRHDEHDIRPLSAAARERYVASWQQVQAQFVDDPSVAVSGAERLIESVMAERGYPVEDFDQRADDLSVDYPEVVENYRKARDLARQGESEDLRRAIRHQRMLFEQLLSDADEPAEVVEAR